MLFKTSDGGNSWQTISPDLTRPHPGIPASLGELAAKDDYAAKVRGAIYALAPSFKDVNTLWAGTDDGLIWITARWRQELEQHHSPGADAVEQGDADLRLALR